MRQRDEAAASLSQLRLKTFSSSSGSSRLLPLSLSLSGWSRLALLVLVWPLVILLLSRNFRVSCRSRPGAIIFSSPYYEASKDKAPLFSSAQGPRKVHPQEQHVARRYVDTERDGGTSTPQSTKTRSHASSRPRVASLLINQRPEAKSSHEIDFVFAQLMPTFLSAGGGWGSSSFRTCSRCVPRSAVPQCLHKGSTTPPNGNFSA